MKQNQHSVRLWLEAANLEQERERKSKVLRKALEFIPNSEKLWKEAIALEDTENAKILLLRAVQCVPNSVDMWLALAKLCPFKEAQTVLNEARKKIPTSLLIWVNAARLQERGAKMGGVDVDKLFPRAIESLKANGVSMDRDTWLKHAEEAEKSNYPKTCAAIVNATITLGVERMQEHDQKGIKKIWIQDAEALESRGSIQTAKAVWEAAVKLLPTKKGIWRRYGDMEAKHGSRESLDAVLARGCEWCPGAEVLWLMRAKQKWLGGDINGARRVLTHSFCFLLFLVRAEPRRNTPTHRDNTATQTATCAPPVASSLQNPSFCF